MALPGGYPSVPPGGERPSRGGVSKATSRRWFLLGFLSTLLLLLGLYFLLMATGVVQMAASIQKWWATPTPTPTLTFTPMPTVPTPTPTLTPTLTPTGPPTPTPTPDEPWPSVVQPGDTLIAIADRFQVDLITLMLYNGLNNQSILRPGEEIIIPLPGMKAPTPTPLPSPWPPVIEYFVLPGDTLVDIARKFNTTVDAIREANGMAPEETLQAGDIIKVPVNITPTPET